jgi:hypothetical protein
VRCGHGAFPARQNRFPIYKKQTPWPESAGELYPPSYRRLSAKLVPIFVDKGMSRNTRFKNMFSNSEFGLQCIVCDRDLMKASNKHVDILRLHFSDPTTWLR